MRQTERHIAHDPPRRERDRPPAPRGRADHPRRRPRRAARPRRAGHRRRRHRDVVRGDRARPRPLRPRARARPRPATRAICERHPRRGSRAVTDDERRGGHGPAARPRADDRRRRRDAARGHATPSASSEIEVSEHDILRGAALRLAGVGTTGALVQQAPEKTDERPSQVAAGRADTRRAGRGDPAQASEGNRAGHRSGQAVRSAPPAARTTRYGPRRYVPLPVLRGHHQEAALSPGGGFLRSSDAAGRVRPGSTAAGTPPTGSVSTLTSAGAPAANARSSAGPQLAPGVRTSSPWPPSASTTHVVARLGPQLGRHRVAVDELHRMLLQAPDAVVAHDADDVHAVARERVELHPREAERAVAEQQHDLAAAGGRASPPARSPGPEPRQPNGPGSSQQPGAKESIMRPA